MSIAQISNTRKTATPAARRKLVAVPDTQPNANENQGKAKPAASPSTSASTRPPLRRPAPR